MRHALTCPPINASDREATPSFNVLIAYEDFETGKHAKETYDFLVENVGHDCHFTNQMWKFDVLLLPRLQAIALEDAARADIIIVSSKARELPAHVTSWIEAWLGQAQHPLALVALFQTTPAEPDGINRARQYLAEVARRGNMEFFAQPDLTPQEVAGPAQISGASRLVDQTLSGLAGAVRKQSAFPRWTLNE